MKFVVDELPYYGEFCPFWKMCYDSGSDDKCKYRGNLDAISMCATCHKFSNWELR